MATDYVLLNSTGPLVWNNPTYAHHDQQLVLALQSQLQDQDGCDEQHQLQADQAPLLPLYGGLKFLTYYCGPGNWSVDGNTVQTSYFSSIDQCCKHHDECPDTIVNRGDYHQYDDLPYKTQLFTSCFDYEYPVMECAIKKYE
uniref:Phospholipase A2-like central domain-containing protein n=1 Tax=Anopheles atroparvus TaxID=41427 RepID=A0A182J7A2_ANOAO